MEDADGPWSGSCELEDTVVAVLFYETPGLRVCVLCEGGSWLEWLFLGSRATGDEAVRGTRILITGLHE